MSHFHETIKSILADVSIFLNSTLKDVNLNKSAQKERRKILDSLKKLYEEYEVLNPDIEEGSSNSSKALSVSDESRFTTGSSHSHGSEEDAGADSIPYTTVKALKDPIKLGFLQKKPTDLLEKFGKQKKYCVIHKNVFYWFKKPADKKHQGAVFLTGYELKDLSQTDREFVFELSSARKQCYQFQADNKEDLEEWKRAVESGIRFVDQITEIKEDVDEGGSSGEEYEPIDDVVQSMKNRREAAPTSAAMSAMTLPTPAKTLPPTPDTPHHRQLSEEQDFPQDEYADGFSMPSAPTPAAMSAMTLPTSAKTLPPIPDTPHHRQLSKEQDFPQEEYADGFSMPSEMTQVQNKKSPATVTASITATKAPSIPLDSDFIDDDDGIYECVGPQQPLASINRSGSDPDRKVSVENDEVPPPRPPPPSSSPLLSASQAPPPLPSRGANIPQPPLPPTPNSASLQTPLTPPPPPVQGKITPVVDTTLKTVKLLEEDYENIFYGKFTCVGDSANELNFNRGDIIHVLSRDIALQNWWVAESFGRVGLVPMEYLTPVYEMVA